MGTAQQQNQKKDSVYETAVKPPPVGYTVLYTGMYSKLSKIVDEDLKKL